MYPNEDRHHGANLSYFQGYGPFLVFRVVECQKEVQGQEAPKLQVLSPVFEHVLSEVRHDLDNLNSHEV